MNVQQHNLFHCPYLSPLGSKTVVISSITEGKCFKARPWGMRRWLCLCTINLLMVLKTDFISFSKLSLDWSSILRIKNRIFATLVASCITLKSYPLTHCSNSFRERTINLKIYSRALMVFWSCSLLLGSSTPLKLFTSSFMSFLRKWNIFVKSRHSTQKSDEKWIIFQKKSNRKMIHRIRSLTDKKSRRWSAHKCRYPKQQKSERIFSRQSEKWYESKIEKNHIRNRNVHSVH